MITKALLIAAALVATAAAQDTTATPARTAATACFEPGGEYVRLTDAEGKKHRYSAYIIGDESDQDWADFEHSRKTVALDPSAILTVKTGKDVHGEYTLAKMGPIPECPAKKRGGFPKL